jgi:sulfoxide reductase catalytic subunit YedY
MLIKRRRGWELPESAATPEPLFHQRRRLIKGMAAGPILLAGGAGLWRAASAEAADPTADLYPVQRNPRYQLDERIPELSDEQLVTTYNNFYEFGSHKQISQAAQALEIRPWTVALGGMVEQEQTLDIDDLIRRMPLEERVYRHRCVEAWSMAVPWSGFPMRALVELARPLGGARYLRMETFLDPETASGQKQFWYPWPYVEGLTMAEATHELAFIATGLYGQPIAKQNGAPLRLAVPWKYGFKSIKSIVRFTFTDERPKSFWEEIQGNEYGFWANVNPEVPHPRWSQAEETPLGSPIKVPTVLYNGYAEFVADLYKGLESEPLFM